MTSMSSFLRALVGNDRNGRPITQWVRVPHHPSRRSIPRHACSCAFGCLGICQTAPRPSPIRWRGVPTGGRTHERGEANHSRIRGVVLSPLTRYLFTFNLALRAQKNINHITLCICNRPRLNSMCVCFDRLPTNWVSIGACARHQRHRTSLKITSLLSRVLASVGKSPEKKL